MKNRIVVEMARSMLQTKGLHNMYYADPVQTKIYILNRSPATSLEKMTLYEAWYEKKPNFNHFKVFDCFVMHMWLMNLGRSLVLRVKHAFLLSEH